MAHALDSSVVFFHSCGALTNCVWVGVFAGSLGSRRWSSLAKWKLRELNELPHYIQHR